METTTIRTIRPEELAQRAQSGKVELIDVRTPAEFEEVHVEFAKNVPLAALSPKTVTGGRFADDPLYVICRTGNRAEKACDAIRAAGFTNVFNVEGGTQAWDAAGLPVVRGRKAMSLERQVRIAAGSIVLLGLLLAWLVHPALAGLSAFAGAGLVFSGITDTCGMGLVLARMPWNQVRSSRTAKAECANPTNSSTGCCG
jgi:rhodanese-related sulfurtransferase